MKLCSGVPLRLAAIFRLQLLPPELIARPVFTAIQYLLLAHQIMLAAIRRFAFTLEGFLRKVRSSILDRHLAYQFGWLPSLTIHLDLLRIGSSRFFYVSSIFCSTLIHLSDRAIHVMKSLSLFSLSLLRFIFFFFFFFPSPSLR